MPAPAGIATQPRVLRARTDWQPRIFNSRPDCERTQRPAHTTTSPSCLSTDKTSWREERSSDCSQRWRSKNPGAADRQRWVADQPDTIGVRLRGERQAQQRRRDTSRQWFRKLWDKLLCASAIEAMMQRAPNEKAAPVAAQAVKESFTDADSGKPAARNISGCLKRVSGGKPKRTCSSTRAMNATRAFTRTVRQQNLVHCAKAGKVGVPAALLG